MIYKYEMACKEAGLSEEQTAEIRKYFDAEKKRLKRRNNAIEETEFHYFSINKIIDEEGEIDTYEIHDVNADTELEAIRNWELEKLREYMSELSDDDRNFLYACFDDVRGADERIAKKLGISRQRVQYRKSKLINHLRKNLWEKFKIVFCTLVFLRPHK